MFKVVLIFVDHGTEYSVVLIMGVLTNFAVAVSILSALPWVRNTHHKWDHFIKPQEHINLIYPVRISAFERHHRFVGW